MTTQTPVFEKTTSALYYSNDGRLHVRRDGDEHIVVDVGDATVVRFTGDEVEVFRTLDRVKADAYIAGYDLADEIRK